MLQKFHDLLQTDLEYLKFYHASIYPFVKDFDEIETMKGKLEESSGAQIRRRITNEISRKESALMKKLQPVDIVLKRKVSNMMHSNPVKSEGNREVRNLHTSQAYIEKVKLNYQCSEKMLKQPGFHRRTLSTLKKLLEEAKWDTSGNVQLQHIHSTFLWSKYRRDGLGVVRGDMYRYPLLEELNTSLRQNQIPHKHCVDLQNIALNALLKMESSLDTMPLEFRTRFVGVYQKMVNDIIVDLKAWCNKWSPDFSRQTLPITHILSTADKALEKIASDLYRECHAPAMQMAKSIIECTRRS